MFRRRAGSRSTLIVVLLVATLAMTAVLAYQALQAARSHRVAAENVLRDYAAFAAWELSRVARRELLDSLNAELTRLQQEVNRRGLDEAVRAVNKPGPTCAGVRYMRTAFRAPLSDGAAAIAGEPMAARPSAAVTRLIDDVRRAPDAHDCPALIVVRGDGPPALLVWRVIWDRARMPTAIVGFVTDREFVASVIQRVLDGLPLLPPSLVPSGKPNGALSVRVSTADGAELFTSPGSWSEYAAENQLAADLGSLRLAVALRPDAAGRLVIGGLPRERLPLVVGLLALTTGLVIVALVQLRREAELARLRSDFVSGVSHELRTPLAQIRMFSETLLLGRVRSDREGRRSLAIIAREAQRLSQLVENVLFFARSERRRPQIARQTARLAPIVAEVVESFTPLAAARQARIVAHHEDAAVSVWADVDAGAVRQILLNLLDNAVKYGPAGQTVTVALRLDGDRARLTVEDEGPGVDPRDAERIWQPFNRLAGAEAAVTGGAGIGLAIVRQLVDLHGGRAWVEPGPSPGARFVIEIPGAWREASTASPEPGRGASAVA
jgi:signal transduction histidine kinase